MVSQHAGLSTQRWKSFTPTQQILMIANEMNRGQKMFDKNDIYGIKLSIERVLYLLDITIAINTSFGLRKELLRLRDLVAELYIIDKIELKEYKKIFKTLLLLNSESARQIPFVQA